MSDDCREPFDAGRLAYRAWDRIERLRGSIHWNDKPQYVYSFSIALDEAYKAGYEQGRKDEKLEAELEDRFYNRDEE